MAYDTAQFLEVASSPEGSTPYIRKIHENLLFRLVEMGKVDAEYIMPASRLDDDAGFQAVIDADREALFQKIEYVFGAGREYEDAAYRAFEEACPDAVHEAIDVLVEYVLPTEKLCENIAQGKLLNLLQENRVPIASKMAQNIRGEISKIFNECRNNQYIANFGSVFGLDICESDRQEYIHRNNVLFKCAWDAGRDRDRHVGHSPDS